jgi:hypothetical protein
LGARSSTNRPPLRFQTSGPVPRNLAPVRECVQFVRERFYRAGKTSIEENDPDFLCLLERVCVVGRPNTKKFHCSPNFGREIRIRAGSFELPHCTIMYSEGQSVSCHDEFMPLTLFFGFPLDARGANLKKNVSGHEIITTGIRPPYRPGYGTVRQFRIRHFQFEISQPSFPVVFCRPFQTITLSFKI